ncbi:MAG: 2Fe-2S iron-sulfur cluster-binding protein, partial [Myxococcota bacterium]
QPRLDQTRLDVQSIIDSLRGKREAPFRSDNAGPRPPTPLESIDPVEHVLPKSIARRYVATRRDIRFLTLSLRGQHPPPFTQRRADTFERRRDAGRRPALETKTVRVTAVQRTTPDAVTLMLEASSGSFEDFEPGQFMTIAVDIEGVRYQRAYSICTPRTALPRLAITVKRVEGGVVSNYLNDRVCAGDLIRVRGPSGSFCIRPNPEAQRHFVLFAAGSGITPMMSILDALLREEPDARVDLIFGNRNEQSILFQEQLEQYAAEFPDRFSVRHVLSRASEDWQGARGRVDRPAASAWLDSLETGSIEPMYLLCGPGPMMESVREELLSRGVPSDRIQQERFVTPRADVRTALPTTPQQATFVLDGVAHDLTVEPGASLLQAGLDAGLPLGHSCTMGGCGACKVKMRRGAVHMDEPNALTPQEREAGYVLACIAHPTEPLEVESK